MQNNPEIKKILWSSLAHKIRSTPPLPPPPLDFHVSKNRWRILSGPLPMMTGFWKGGVHIFCSKKPTKSGPLTNNMLPVRKVNPPLGFTKHKISERKTNCKEESRSMLAWTICCAIACLLKTDYKLPYTFGNNCDTEKTQSLLNSDMWIPYLLQ